MSSTLVGLKEVWPGKTNITSDKGGCYHWVKKLQSC